MVIGIPYFGVSTQEITEKIINSDITQDLKFDSLYIMIKNYMYKRVVVVIENQWLAWLNDITFNYRDKECYIPYFTYELFEDNSKKYRSNNKGHLILNDDSLSFRFNYNYKELDICVDNLSLIIYDLDTDEKIRISTNTWIKSKEFSVNKLYNLYLDSCYKDNDYLYNWNGDIYHRILEKNKHYRNKEKELRSQYDLLDIVNIDSIKQDYRDVRQYKIEEVISKVGFRETSDLYRLRRLKFESYLYCILRQGCIPEEQYIINDWNNLGVTKDYIKIGENIKLIIKSYWLDNYKPIKKRTWSRT